MCTHHVTMSFYIGVHSGADGDSAGKFTCRLNREVVLPCEYDVAVASVTRYFQTDFKDLVVVRNPRAVDTDVLDVQVAYPNVASDMEVELSRYLTSTPAIIAAKANPNYFSIMNVGQYSGAKSQILPNYEFLKYSDIDATVQSEKYHGAEYTIRDILEGQAALDLKFDMSKLAAKDYVDGKCLVEIEFSNDFVQNFKVLPKISLKIAAATTGDKIHRQTILLRTGSRTRADWPDLRKSLPYVYWRPVDAQNMLIPGTEGEFRVYPEATKTTTVKDYRHPLLHWRDVSVPHQGVALSHIRLGVVMSQHVQTAYGFAKRAFVIEPAKVVIEIKGVETFTIPIQDTKQLDDFATNLNNLAIPEPYILKAAQKGRTITIKHPPAGVKIRLPHVLGNYYDFTTTKEAERWTATILYYDDVSMGQVEKIYTIDAKKSWPAQVSEHETAHSS